MMSRDHLRATCVLIASSIPQLLFEACPHRPRNHRTSSPGNSGTGVIYGFSPVTACLVGCGLVGCGSASYWTIQKASISITHPIPHHLTMISSVTRSLLRAPVVARSNVLIRPVAMTCEFYPPKRDEAFFPYRLYPPSPFVPLP